MKKLLIICMIGSSLIAGEIACKYHTKSMDGKTDRMRYSLKIGNYKSADDTLKRMEANLLDMIEHCGIDDKYTKKYITYIKNVNDIMKK